MLNHKDFGLEERVKNSFLNRMRKSLARKIVTYGLSASLALGGFGLTSCGGDGRNNRKDVTPSYSISEIPSIVKNIPIGSSIVNPDFGFNWYLDNVPNFKANEVLVLNDNNGASIVSSLGSYFVGSGLEDDYQDRVHMEVLTQGAIRYYSLIDSVDLTYVSTMNPLEIEFLGKNLEIVSVDPTTPDTKFTAYIGDKYFLNQGESVVVESKTVTLENVGSTGSIVVDVDGVLEIITSGNTETVNGIEIVNYESFYTSAGKEQTSALLIMGKDVAATIKDGDPYMGGDSICQGNNPIDPDCWRWRVKNLVSGQATSITNDGSIIENGIILGVYNYFIINDDTDNPPGVGGCLKLPNEYASICLDSLTNAIYKDYNFELTEIDLSKFGLGIKKAVNINSNGLMFLKQNNLETDNVWLVYDSGFFKVFCNNNGVKYAGDINKVPYDGTFVPVDTANLAGLDNIDMFFMINNLDHFELRLRPFDPLYLPGYRDDISISYYFSGNEINSLGEFPLTREANELRYEGILGLGTKDEDHRSMYGIVIKNPYQNGAEDKVRLSIPDQQIFAKVSIKGKN